MARLGKYEAWSLQLPTKDVEPITWSRGGAPKASTTYNSQPKTSSRSHLAIVTGADLVVILQLPTKDVEPITPRR